MGCCGSKKEVEQPQTVQPQNPSTVQKQNPTKPQQSSTSNQQNPVSNKQQLNQEQIQPTKLPTKRDYEKSDLIGTGAFSKVYLALDKKHGRMMAIKTVKLQGDREQINRTILALKSEVKLLKKLKHKNIIKYYFTEVGPDQTYVDIALEYISQGSLRKVLDFVRLEESTVRMYTKQILEGVNYLHNEGVIHRDIKAANILVDHDGTIKLTDFGTSKVIETEEQLIQQNKSLKGTPYWMAPEVCQMKGATFASDIWSVGGVVIEMIGGMPPFADKYGKDMDVGELLKKIATDGKPNYPNKITPLAKDFLDQIFVPADRRPSADKLLQHPYAQVDGNQSTVSDDTRYISRLNKQPSSDHRVSQRYTDERPIVSTYLQNQQLQDQKQQEIRLQKQREWEKALQDEIRRKSQQ